MDDRERTHSEYIGKYVCYDQADGGACWGRIKDEAKVNTMKGEKEVFILADRYVRYVRGKSLKDFRRYYPDMNDPALWKPMSKNDPDSEFFHEVRKIKGDSTLRKEMIDLDKDIVDLSDILSVVSEEVLFKAVLSRSSGQVGGRNALEIGIRSLIADSSMSDEAAAVLKSRMGIEL